MNDNQVSSTLVDGIMVPKLYTRREIPIDPSEVATPLKLKKWH